MIAKKENVLFFTLGGFFITNALVAELIGGKIFSVEKTLGLAPANLTVFGFDGLSFNMSAGSILWPFVFVMTDIINEYYGRKGVRYLSFLAAGLIVYAFIMIFLAMEVHPADFWLSIYSDVKPDINYGFKKVFGQGLNIIIGSVTAFLLGQFLDVYIFQRLRKVTGEKMIWLRAVGSTVVSQLIDSFVVAFIAFYVLGDMELKFLLALVIVGYLFKFVVAVLMTPLLYFVHWAVERYLGHERAHELKQRAVSGNWL